MRQRKRKKAESEREKERWGIAYRSRYVGGPGRVGCVAMEPRTQSCGAHGVWTWR